MCFSSFLPWFWLEAHVKRFRWMTSIRGALWMDSDLLALAQSPDSVL